jgi:rod shape-determining protein MreC
MIGNATGLAEMKAENARLLGENERLREWYQRALALQVENKALQSLLNVKISPELEFETARIMSDHSNSYVRSILVAAGENDGLQEGQPVLSGEGVLGRIVELGQNTARVLLLTDLNARIPVVIEGSNTHAVLSGTNDDLPVLTHTSEDTQFKIGDRLMTSGMGGIYPAGLPVGVVAKVEGSDVYVKPYGTTDRTHFVRIITNAENPNLRLNRLQ